MLNFVPLVCKKLENDFFLAEYRKWNKGPYLKSCSVFRTEPVQQASNGGGKDEMDILRMLSDLRSERAQIEEAIVTLERLAQGRGKRRGRPPSWMVTMKRRGRPPGSKNKAMDEVAA